MREIKFRCFNAHAGCMHGWRELIEMNKIHLIANQQGSYPIMQFTGMKDKYGVEIYEGDILEDSPAFRYESGEYIRAVVAFNNCEFVASYEHPDKKVYYERLNNSFTVVGNIHQHAYLLEK